MAPVWLGWCWNELSVLRTTPKGRTDWLELEGTLGGGHYTRQAVAGQAETEARTVVAGHPEGEAACGAEAGTAEGAGQAQKLELLAVMGLEFSVISRCGVVHGLYFCSSSSPLFSFAGAGRPDSQACRNVPTPVGQRPDERCLFSLDPS